MMDTIEKLLQEIQRAPKRLDLPPSPEELVADQLIGTRLLLAGRFDTYLNQCEAVQQRVRPYFTPIRSEAEMIRFCVKHNIMNIHPACTTPQLQGKFAWKHEMAHFKVWASIGVYGEIGSYLLSTGERRFTFVVPVKSIREKFSSDYIGYMYVHGMSLTAPERAGVGSPLGMETDEGEFFIRVAKERWAKRKHLLDKKKR